jgi:NitT/TauT family transport system substrate-binding protein
MRIVVEIWLAVVLLLVVTAQSFSQERIKIAYSSADASNVVWFTALDAGLYKKHGLDVELVFIQSSTMSVSTLVSGDIQVGARWRVQSWPAPT